MKSKTKIKYLIVGAGISGLTFANICKDDYLIVEKENSIGGYCKTFKVGEFIWDCAGHFYHFKNPIIRQNFLNLYPKDELINKDKNTKILYKDKLIDYPFQMNIHQLEKDEFIDCLYDLNNKKEQEKYENFVEMLYGKFGQSIVDKFLKPYNEKLYSCDLTSLDTDAMGRFFPYANINDIINNMKEKNNSSYNNTFLYPKGGAQTFIDKLYNNLNKDKVLLNTGIVKIDYKNHIAYTIDGKEIEFDYLINTSPFNQFLEFIGEDNLAKNLSYNKVLVFNMGFKKDSKFKQDWIYIPDKETSFYRIGFYNNILNQNKLSLYIEIGFNKNDRIDVDYYYNRVLGDLEKIGITKNNELECYNHIIMDPAYVHINDKNTKEIEKINEELEKNNIYSIGRYGAWTYCSMEDCIVMAENTLKKIVMKEGN